MALAGVLLAALAAPAGAAEVLLDVEGHPDYLEVLVDRLTLADGTRQDRGPQRLHGSNLLPGNVVAFTLALRTLADPTRRYYEIECSPRPDGRSIIVVYADVMRLAQEMPLVRGTFAGQLGACRKARYGIWRPDRGWQWKDGGGPPG